MVVAEIQDFREERTVGKLVAEDGVILELIPGVTRHYVTIQLPDGVSTEVLVSPSFYERALTAVAG